jgi:hypothetical protein
MGSPDQSEDINRLTFRVIKALVQRTGGDPRIAVKFVEVYGEGCMRQDIGNSEEYDKSNAKMRQHIRDNLLKNKYVIVDPKDVDSVFITRKAIDVYSDNL